MWLGTRCPSGLALLCSVALKTSHATCWSGSSVCLDLLGFVVASLWVCLVVCHRDVFPLLITLSSCSASLRVYCLPVSVHLGIVLSNSELVRSSVVAETRWPLATTRPKPWCFKNRASSPSGDRPESRSDNAEPRARSGRTPACASVGPSGTKVADRQISSCGSVNSSGARADRKIAACVSVSLSETKAGERGLGTGGSVNVSGARVPERAIAAGGSVSLSGTRVPDRTLAGIKSISLSGTRSRPSSSLVVLDVKMRMCRCIVSLWVHVSCCHLNITTSLDRCLVSLKTLVMLVRRRQT